MKIMRLLDFAVYVAIGLAVVLATYWCSLHFGRDPEPVGKWVGLAGTTLILFGYAIREHWHHRHRKRFWLTASILFFIHVFGFWIILVSVDHWNVLWFVLAFPFENIAIDATFALTGHNRVPKRKLRRTGS